MSNRFSPSWNKIKQPLDNIVNKLEGDNDLLVKAFKSAADPAIKVSNNADVKRQLKLVIEISNNVPWILFDTITALLQSLPEPFRKAIIQDFFIPSNTNKFERLQPNLQGQWQVVWQIADTGDLDDDFIALDWYLPPDKHIAPVVPDTIIDFVAGGVSLIHNNSLLPAAALLMIALESALWDGLAKKGISRHTEQIAYSTIKWKFKRIGDKLALTTEDAPDRSLSDMDAVVGMKPAEGTLELCKLNTNGEKSTLQLTIDNLFVEFLATNTETSREIVPTKGLSEAVQRARKESVLDTIPSQLDQTLVKLRNNLIHLPSNGVLNPPVPAPDGGEFLNLDELRQEPKMVKALVPLVIEIINIIYSTP